MKIILAAAGMAGVFALSFIPALQAADPVLLVTSSEKRDGKQDSHKQTDKKQAGDSTKRGPMGEEQTGGAGPSGTTGGEGQSAPGHEGAAKQPGRAPTTGGPPSTSR